MPEMTPAMALRDLKQMHAGLKKARQLVTQARESPALAPAALDTGWESLVRAHRLMASIPRSAVDEAVLGQQISLQRYATALLVRLRRLLRRDAAPDGELGDELEDDE